jgi:hypothetical protein
MAIRKNKKRIDPRYFLHETTHRDIQKDSSLSENKEYWDDLFGNKWGDEHTWKMVTANSLVGVYNNMGFTDPQRFIDGLPYEWQKPKATQALQDAGILKGDAAGGSFTHSAAGTAGDPARAKKTRDFKMDPRTGKVSE